MMDGQETMEILDYRESEKEQHEAKWKERIQRIGIKGCLLQGKDKGLKKLPYGYKLGIKWKDTQDVG